jgi:membrane-associated phospholipid phosphatase
MIRRACAGFCLSVSVVGFSNTAQAQAALPPTPDVVNAGSEAAAKPATPAGEPAGISERIPAFKELFTPLAGDFKRLSSRQNLTLGFIGLSGALAAHPVDTSLAQAPWANNDVNGFFAPGQQVGSFAVQTSAAFATYFVGRALHNARVATVGAELVRAQIVSQTATQIIKLSAQRTRPDGTTLSFPSGHTASAFATAAVLHQEFGWKAGIPAYAVAAWVGASRMEGKRHYFSDVLAGATLGIMAGRSVTVGRGAAKFELSPMAAPGGIGVNFVKIGK